MAIQTINLTVPGGDTPRSANTKINANFSNTTHAASKLIGTGRGQIPLAEDVNQLAHISYVGATTITGNPDITSLAQIPAGGSHYIGSSSKYSDVPEAFTNGNYIRFEGYGSSGLSILHGYGGHATSLLYMRSQNTMSGWMKIYHDKNTTVDSNGLIKPSSPVLRVFSDRIEGNADADTMQAVFTKNGVGDYTISNTTGLRTDGWYITIPNDMNGNPKVAVTLEETNGVISLKTYKRIFSMETFTFGPDLEQPLDISEGRWIDLRLNEIPAEEVNP